MKVDLQFNEVFGIAPQSTWVMGRGFVREELKSLAFEKGVTLGAHAISGFSEFIETLLPEGFQNIRLSEVGRQSFLEELFSKATVRNSIPILSESRRKKRFLRRLDQQLSRGRSMFATLHEAEIQHAILDERMGKSPLRQEYLILASAIENTFKSLMICDDLLAMRIGLERLESTDAIDLPKNIIFFEHLHLTRLEETFLQALEKRIPVRRWKIPLNATADIKRFTSHTIEDAASFLISAIAHEPDREHAIVIEDSPDLRRILKRELKKVNGALKDPRDPVALLEDEKLKSILAQAGTERGRMSLSEFADKLRVHEYTALNKILERFEKEFEVLGLAHRKKPIAILLENLREAIRSEKPSPTTLRPRSNIGLYRIDQVPSLTLSENAKIHLFGLSKSAFEAQEIGAEWYSARECFLLSQDFLLPTIVDKTEEIQGNLKSWLYWRDEVNAWEARYDWSGAELQSLDLQWSQITSAHSHYLGAHEQWIDSLSAQPSLKKADLFFPAALRADREYPFTFLEEYGRCPFRAYAGKIEKWRDEEDLEFDIRSDAWGQVLHDAAEKMIRFHWSEEKSLDEAWLKLKREGFLKSERIETASRDKALRILKSFKADEALYQNEIGAKPKYFESDLELYWQADEFKFKGRPDRIDEHTDGFFILDYKTWKKPPTAKDIKSKDSGFQIALYALSTRQKLQREVIGAYYVTLNLPSERKRGVHFAGYTKLDGKSGSFVKNQTPEEFWNGIEAQIQERIYALKQGDFSARPKDESQCDECDFKLSCGQLRRTLHLEEGA